MWWKVIGKPGVKTRMSHSGDNRMNICVVQYKYRWLHTELYMCATWVRIHTYVFLLCRLRGPRKNDPGGNDHTWHADLGF